MNSFERERQKTKMYKEMYPAGTRIELISMANDPHPIESGTRGTVDAVDDNGTIHCSFDNGRYLGIIPGEDSFRKLTPEEIETENDELSQDDDAPVQTM